MRRGCLCVCLCMHLYMFVCVFLKKCLGRAKAN